MTRLFHLSDLHFGTEDRAALDWVQALVARERPDAVVVTGDLTARARTREFAACGEWLRALDVPVSIEPGNHDLPYFDLMARFLDPYGRFRVVEAAIERPLTLAHVRLIPLRTTTRAQLRLNWALGVVRPRALAQTLKNAYEAGDERLRLVTCHHPLAALGAARGRDHTKGGPVALELLARAGVHAVLSGHVHDPFDQRWVGADGHPLRLIGAGTLSERVRSSPPSFNDIHASTGELVVTLRQMGSDQP